VRSTKTSRRAMETVEAAHPSPHPGKPYGFPTAPTVPTASTTTGRQNTNNHPDRQTVTHVPGLDCHLSARLLSPTAPPPVPSGCLQRAQFGDPASSSYVLPYSVGESYEVITGYCDIFTFPDHLGWDFDLPQGTSVVATRRGTVLEVGCFKGTEASDSARSVEQRTLNSD